MEVRKIRDLSLICLDKDTTLVVACDSCGGIGSKEGDILKVPPFYVGKFISRVPIMEVMCSGAEVITITNAVCNEMNNTGSDIIKGIRQEMLEADIAEAVLTGSTEENFKPISTALGVTVIGIAKNCTLRINSVAEEAVVISIGLPKVGGEIDFIKDNEIVTYEDIKRLLALKEVYEIVPVGSKGIAYEAEQLAAFNHMEISFDQFQKVDLHKSSGPSTCVIAAVSKEQYSRIVEANDMKNINYIGKLKIVSKA
jgi:hypothetical protein